MSSPSKVSDRISYLQLPNQESHPTNKESFNSILGDQTPSIKDKILWLDIFKYDKIPSIQRQSSCCSIFCSGLLITGFILLTIYTVFEFITNNPPSLNVYQTNLSDRIYTFPNLAMSFLTNVNGKIITPDIYDTSIFNIQMDQAIYELDLSKAFIPIPMKRCTDDQVIWMGMIKRGENLLCPSKPINLQGLLNFSPRFQYTRVVIRLCDPTTSKTCETNQTRIDEVLAGGRIYLYLEQPDQVRLKNFRQEKSLKFKTYQLFLAQDIYTRNKVILKNTNYIIYPDYFGQWRTENQETLSTTGHFDSYVTDAIANNDNIIFEMWFTLESQIDNVEAVYTTSIDKIATLGALWGVLYALFAYCSYQFNKRNDNKSYSIITNDSVLGV